MLNKLGIALAVPIFLSKRRTQGKVSSHILRMLGPSSVAIVALLSAGIIDTIYLGHLTNPNIPDMGVLALAAVGFAYPLTFVGNSANIGLGAGTLSAVSRAIGQGDMCDVCCDFDHVSASAECYGYDE